MNDKICQLAADGFREIADRAAVLRDELREAGAPQDLISRVDRILFAAEVGQNTANLQPVPSE